MFQVHAIFVWFYPHALYPTLSSYDTQSLSLSLTHCFPHSVRFLCLIFYASHFCFVFLQLLTLHRFNFRHTQARTHTLLHLHPHIHTYTRTHRQRNSCWGSHTHRVKCKFLSSDLFLVRVFRAPISGSPRPTNTHATPFPPPPVPRIYPRKSKIELEHYGRAKQRLRYAWGTGVSHVFSLCISFCFDMPEYLA